MSVTSIAAIVFCILALILVLFQLALVLGAPWGQLAMGGRWPGRMPPGARVSAAVQGALMAAMARVTAGHAGLMPAIGPDWLIWGVVAIIGISTLLNNITPSLPERRLWGPVTVIMFIAVVLVAIRG